MARSWVLLAVASLLSALLVTVHIATPALPAAAAPAARGPLSQTSVITNNIQGIRANGDAASKWTTMIQGFANTADIVLIQEAGPDGPPNSAEQQAIETDGNIVRHFFWQAGTGRVGNDALLQVYFLQTDDNGGTAVGGRVNIAIVTRHVPDEVRVVANPNAPGRDALGVRFGNNWYFSFHGLSGNSNGGVRGADSPALLNAIATTVAGWNPSYTYTVGGDFNRDPADLANAGIPAGAVILSTGLATHQAGGELDYFVTNDPTAPADRPTRMNGRQSDQWSAGCRPPRARRTSGSWSTVTESSATSPMRPCSG